MQEKSARRKAIQAYKEKEDVGGIYRYTHTASGWQGPIQATPNIAGKHNSLRFAKKTNAPAETSLAKVWHQYDTDGFEIMELERLTRKPEQTIAEFREELGTLLKMYAEEHE